MTRDVRWRSVGISLACLLGLALCTGCTYLKNRGNDFLDVVWADVGYGLGVGVDMQLTAFSQSGLGVYRMAKSGLTRREFKTWNEFGAALLLGRMVLYDQHPPARPPGEHDGERRGSLIYPTAIRSLLGDEFKAEGRPRIHIVNPRAPWMNAFDVDIGVALIVIGARVGLSPGEGVDFLLGWFGLDIGEDDIKGPKPITEDEEIAMLLFWAIHRGDIAAARIALQNYPHLSNAASKWSRVPHVKERRWRPLHLAAAKGEREIAGLLLARNADTNARDTEGMTPLHVAVKHDSGNVARVLLARGADVNARTKKGFTPLALAIMDGRKEMADLLRQHGGKE